MRTILWSPVLLVMVSMVMSSGANADWRDAVCSVNQGQSSISICLSALGYDDCDSSPLSGFIDCGYEGGEMLIRVNDFLLEVAQNLDFDLDAGILGGVEIVLSDLEAAYVSGGEPVPFSPSGSFTIPALETAITGIVDYDGYGIIGAPIGSGTEALAEVTSAQVTGTVSVAGDIITTTISLPLNYSVEFSGINVAVSGGANVLASGELPSNCPADIVGNGAVDYYDLISLLSAWGSCPGCAADLDEDGLVQFNDLLILLTAWGPCPE